MLSLFAKSFQPSLLISSTTIGSLSSCFPISSSDANQHFLGPGGYTNLLQKIKNAEFNLAFINQTYNGILSSFAEGSHPTMVRFRPRCLTVYSFVFLVRYR